ncbi:MAG: hypothetical protein M1817_001188 [Caeruleum heppii]|nr:MAG: hypothetical protein M1817_001188 [Caeruleum heppii]
MPSALVNTTVQAAVLSATSNILAQAITAYRENVRAPPSPASYGRQSNLAHMSQKPLSIDVIPIFHFVLFTILNCPPNVLWQEFLEHTFPGKTTPPMNPNEKAAANGKSSGPREPTLNIANTAKKFALDQTLGAAVNTILFIAVMAGLRGSSGPEIMDAIRQAIDYARPPLTFISQLPSTTSPQRPALPPDSPQAASSSSVTPVPTSSIGLAPVYPEPVPLIRNESDPPRDRRAPFRPLPGSSKPSDIPVFSMPGPQKYHVPTPGYFGNFGSMSEASLPIIPHPLLGPTIHDPQIIVTAHDEAAASPDADKNKLIDSLRKNHLKTLTDLRRAERAAAQVGQAEFCGPMTSAWAHYVNSNNLLNELRSLTQSYPFSADCLDEAKWMVLEDPTSQRSWNYCWLVLTKINAEGLIQKHAHLQARQPGMWGNRSPNAAQVSQLAATLINEWQRALRQLLRNWETAPSTTGR